MQIVRIYENREKSAICHDVLRTLPDWFGIEESLLGYVAQVQFMPFFAALEDGRAVGFLALQRHTPFACEVAVMGILPAFHRRGIGRALMDACEAYCAFVGAEYLTVKTLDAIHPDAGYARTRAFYRALGFRPLEVFPLLWGEDNPCLMMGKCLGGRPA